MDFNTAYRTYIDLKKRFERGQIGAEEFEAHVNDLLVTDSTGALWQIGVKTGKWYHFDMQKWVEDTPPGLPPLSPTPPPERISNSGAQVSKRPVKAPERISRRPAPERISQPSNQSNYHPPIQQVQKQTSKLPWVIGSVISACACIAVVSVILFTVLSQRPKILGQMTITQEGGSFQNEAVTIQVPVNAVSTPIEIEITQLASVPEPSEGVLEQSSQIGISGPLHNINGLLKVTIPIPDKWLTPDGRLLEDETLVFISDEQVYATSAGLFRDTRPLPTEFDLQARTMTTELIFDGTESVSQTSQHLARVRNKPMSSDVQVEVYIKALKTKAQQEAYTCNQGWFRIYHFGLLSEGNKQKLCEIFNEQKKNLEEAVFKNAFQYRKKFPIDVYLERDKTYGGLAGMKGTDGLAVVSNISRVQGAFIKLNFDMMNFNTSDGLQEVKALAGHELLHIVQYYYNPLITKAYLPAGAWTPQEAYYGEDQDDVVSKRTLLSNEAMSVWFEPIAVGEPSYWPGLEYNNLVDLLKKPLVIPEAKNIDERNKGYGASFFLHFLTNRYGNGLVKEILEDQLKVNSDELVALVVWDGVLKRHGSSLSNEYAHFLETYLIRPDVIIHTEIRDPISRIEERNQGIETVFLDVKLDEDRLEEDRAGAFYAVFTDRQQILIKSSERGYIKAGGTPAHTAIHISLQNFLFKGVRLKVQESDLINSEPGKLGVKISCSSGSSSQACPDSIGLLAYPMPKGAEFELPSYTGALSSADSYIYPGEESGFLWGSNQFAAGKPYQGLYLIAFNNRLSTSDDPTTVTIDLYYSWDKQLEEPVPPADGLIPSVDNDNSDLACDMRAISIMQNYGHGGTPEEAEINNSCLSQALQAGVDPRDNEKYQEFICQCITKYLKDHAPFP